MNFVTSLIRRHPGLSFLVYTILLASGGMASAVAAANLTDELRRIESFAIGGIGIAGTTSEGERALRTLLTDPNASAQLQDLLANATPAGQLYGLLGLRVHDRAAYDQALQNFKVPKDEVQTIAGCIISRTPFKQLFDRIKAGQYDAILERPAR